MHRRLVFHRPGMLDAMRKTILSLHLALNGWVDDEALRRGRAGRGDGRGKRDRKIKGGKREAGRREPRRKGERKGPPGRG
eukprot:4586454-Pyramimonas_sp.AAC.1